MFTCETGTNCWYEPLNLHTCCQTPYASFLAPQPIPYVSQPKRARARAHTHTHTRISDLAGADGSGEGHVLDEWVLDDPLSELVPARENGHDTGREDLSADLGQDGGGDLQLIG